MTINAQGMHFQTLNDAVHAAEGSSIKIENCIGQRYIGSGLSKKKLLIQGTPGNALGAYLDGAEIVVRGNAQDATGDTMNDGMICVHGSSGDATGYAMRGGSIWIQGNIGYRGGIHMKEYQEKCPLLVVGGTAGSFLGEYQAGGNIVVLGLRSQADKPVGNFCGMGMYGGRIYLRSRRPPAGLPERLLCMPADEEDLAFLRPVLARFSKLFEESMEEIEALPFYRITPDSRNPYKQLYVSN